MRKGLTVVFCCVVATSAFAGPKFENCRALEECLAAMDADAHSRPYGSNLKQDDDYRAKLETFGEGAKLELLKRAAGNERAWSSLADIMLEEWEPARPADVPALIAALKKNPGGGVARLLGRIGTSEALTALAEDVRLHGADSQSGWALSQIGDRVFPYLLPLLSDDKKWHDAASIMRDMKSNAVHGLDSWLAIALDSRKPERDRIGALRGIGILGTSAGQAAPSLRPLLAVDDGYGPIPETAKKVLAAMGDKTMASETVLACVPSTDLFDGSFESTNCLERAAVYGDAIFPYANTILTTFANSRTGSDRASGASILGFIGYEPAKARLIELLRDSDWRVVYAAARSLDWLGAADAVPALAKVAKDYWLQDVRDEAATVISDLQSKAHAIARPVALSGSLGYPPRVPLEVDATLAPDVAPCKGGRWTWDGREFQEPNKVDMVLHIASRDTLAAGTLTGRDEGEWGGEVKWQTTSAAPILVVSGNVEGIQPSHEGAVAVIRSGGMWTGGSGYAVGLRHDASGAWRVEEVARFPQDAFGLRTIGPELFVAWSGNRAIVFSLEGIRGVAQCVAPK